MSAPSMMLKLFLEVFRGNTMSVNEMFQDGTETMCRHHHHTICHLKYFTFFKVKKKEKHIWILGIFK